MQPDTLEICLDILTPHTLAAMYIDHIRYLGKPENALLGQQILQEANYIHEHLTMEHFSGSKSKANAYITTAEPHHIPF